MCDHCARYLILKKKNVMSYVCVLIVVTPQVRIGV